MINGTFTTLDIQTNQNCNRRIALKLSAETSTEGRGGDKLVLQDCNLPLNSVAAKNFKYVFGRRRFLYLLSET